MNVQDFQPGMRVKRTRVDLQGSIDAGTLGTVVGAHVEVEWDGLGRGWFYGPVHIHRFEPVVETNEWEGNLELL